MFWWLPSDVLLVLNFFSDPHVRELRTHRICVQHVYETCFSYECQSWVRWIQTQHTVIHSTNTELGGRSCDLLKHA